MNCQQKEEMFSAIDIRIQFKSNEIKLANVRLKYTIRLYTLMSYEFITFIDLQPIVVYEK